MAKMKDLMITIDESTNEILDHLEAIPADRLLELMDRIGFELMERDLDKKLKLSVAEADYLDAPY